METFLNELQFVVSITNINGYGNTLPEYRTSQEQDFGEVIFVG